MFKKKKKVTSSCQKSLEVASTFSQTPLGIAPTQKNIFGMRPRLPQPKQLS